MAYQAAARPDRIKAIAAVAIVHAGLAFAILTGLNVNVMTVAVERLRTFDIEEPPPPPPPPPPEPQRARQAKREAGAPAKKAEASPVVAPKPKIVLPVKTPVPAAPVAGTGSATSSGAAASGTGTGAGGSGNGPGGGGDFSKFTPARRISKIPDREYRRLSATGIINGSVGLTVRVNSDGNPSNCRIVHSSGDRSADSLMCQLTLRYVRFRPARDNQGRPVAQDITWYPNWWKP
jgi:protein TonB